MNKIRARNTLQELSGGYQDDFIRKATRISFDTYEMHMKYNGEWLFSGTYSKADIIKQFPDCIIN